MSAEEEIKKKTVVVDGVQYAQSNLTTQQLMLVRQINLCSLKVTRLELEIGQSRMALLGFLNAFKASNPKAEPTSKKIG